MEKPLKRHPFLVGYSKDHHYGLLLVWKIRQGIRKNIESHRVKSYVDLYFEKEILPHITAEESQLLPLLDKLDPFRVKMEGLYAILKTAMVTIRKGQSCYGELSAFAFLLERQIRFEERLFFPYLEENKTFGYSSLLLIESEQKRDDIDELWTDNFWEKKGGSINYDTVSEALSDLVKRGYTVDFSLQAGAECLSCKEIAISLACDQFNIDEIHRFDGATDPGDEMIVYAISASCYPMRGFLCNAFGMYANEKNSEIVQFLQKAR